MMQPPPEWCVTAQTTSAEDGTPVARADVMETWNVVTPLCSSCTGPLCFSCTARHPLKREGRR